MKLFKSILFFGAILLLLQGCVKGELIIPNAEDRPVTESTAIVSLLNTINERGFSADNFCFDFAYPFTMQFNTGVQIEVDNADAIVELVRSQTRGFYINSIAFPFQVTLGGQSLTISNETSFINLLRECQLSNFTIDFNRFHKQCFELDYPIKVLSREGTMEEITNLDLFLSFIDRQGQDYQISFLFPVKIVDFATDQFKEIHNYYEFYELIDACKACPTPFFTKEVFTVNTYKFMASFYNMDAISYTWVITKNGTLVYSEDEIPGSVNKDNIMEFQFSTGVYEICIQTETPDCPQGKTYCITIEVP